MQVGVDMIEFDVFSERLDGSGRLLLAHDYEALRRARPLTLQEALEHLAGRAYAGIELDVDVKIPGYGVRVVKALREYGLIERSLVSGTFPEELDAMRDVEPSLRVGWSVPRARRDYTEDLLMAMPALAMLTGYRAWLPRRARAELRCGRFDAIMAHWRLVTPALVRAVAAGGGELYVWTVDDAALHGQAHGDGRRRHHHQRPAAVRLGRSRRTAPRVAPPMPPYRPRLRGCRAALSARA